MDEDERKLLINEKMFQLLFGDLSIKNFETWVYEYPKLNEILSEDEYLSLLELDYRTPSVKYEIEKVLDTHLNYGAFEKRKMVMLLREALKRTGKLPQILMEFYELYCSGYTFLEDLGLGYGLMCASPSTSRFSADSWDGLNVSERDQLIKSFYPQLEKDLNRALEWITKGRIILTGERSTDLNHLQYIDKRTDDEKVSSMWVKVANNTENGSSVSKNTMWEKIEKKWWQFWK